MCPFPGQNVLEFGTGGNIVGLNLYEIDDPMESI